MRWVLIAFWGVVSATSPQVTESALAQIEPVGIVTDTPNEVYRRYEALMSELSAVHSGEVMALYSFGYQASSGISAEAEMEYLLENLSSFMDLATGDLQQESGVEISPNAPRRAQLVSIGDASVGYLIGALYGSTEVEFGIVIIRDDAWIQMLVAPAYTNDGSTVRLLEEVALSTKDRWPNESTVRVRSDGIRYGGIWSLAVLPEDVPGHLHLDTAYDEGPGPDAMPTSAEPTPVPTLVPTAAPTPTSVPTPTIAHTPVIEPSSRLAQPFDVTVRIILVGLTYETDGRGGCRGMVGYANLVEGRGLTLKTSDDLYILALSSSLPSGVIIYDLQLDRDVCVFETHFAQVPARSQYLLTSYDTELAIYDYDVISSAGVIELAISR